MASPIRDEIVQAIVARLLNIRVGGVYGTNIGNKVEAARPVFAPEELPATSVTPQPETTEKLYGKSHYTMPVLIESFMLHGDFNPSVVVEKMLADLIVCLATPGIFGPGLIDRIVYHSGGIDDYPGPGDQVTGCRAVFIVHYSQ